MDKTRLAELQQIDRAHHVHPFTNHPEMHVHGTHIIEAANGCYITDETGQKLFDGLAGLWCVNVGYGRHEIADAIQRQISSVCFYPSFFNTTTEPTILLAEKLAAHAPPRLQRAFFCNSGSEANESALKLIRAYQKLRGTPAKRKILSRNFAYHGVTLAATSMTGLASCTAPFDLPLPGFVQVPGPHVYAANSAGTGETERTAAEYGDWCLAETERIIEAEGANSIAAFFAEPVQGAGGVIVPPPGHLKALRELCRQHDILFVADEVITGFGRLGGWFASLLFDLDPDLMTLAKGITSGYVPLGATLVSDEIAETLERGGYFAHGYTYSGHPVATAAGVANLGIIEREGLVERVRDDIGPLFQQRLFALQGHPAVGEVRGYGLIGAIDLVPRAGKAAREVPPVLGTRAVALAREEGIIVRGIADLIAMSPPLIATCAELEMMFAAIGRVLDRLWD